MKKLSPMTAAIGARHTAIIRRAQNHGSTATTVRGAAKWCITHKLLGATNPLSHDELVMRWRMAEKLDHARPGDTVEITEKIRGKRADGYFLTAFVDASAARRSRESAEARNPRKKNLYSGQARIGGEAHQERWETINYKGHFKGYRGSEIHADYQSCIAITASGKSAVIITECKCIRRFRAPAGLRFAHDNNGVLLRRISDGMDYHPTDEDFRAKDFTARVRKAMADNFRKRIQARKVEQQAKRFAAIQAREIGSVRVTLEDSRRAGNCVEGSLKYAESKLGVTREEILNGSYLFSVPASRLLATNGHEGVKRAVNAAWLRETTVSI